MLVGRLGGLLINLWLKADGNLLFQGDNNAFSSLLLWFSFSLTLPSCENLSPILIVCLLMLKKINKASDKIVEGFPDWSTICH